MDVELSQDWILFEIYIQSVQISSETNEKNIDINSNHKYSKDIIVFDPNDKKSSKKKENKISLKGELSIISLSQIKYNWSIEKIYGNDDLEMDILNGPGKELDNSWIYTNPNLISSMEFFWDDINTLSSLTSNELFLPFEIELEIEDQLYNKKQKYQFICKLIIQWLLQPFHHKFKLLKNN